MRRLLLVTLVVVLGSSEAAAQPFLMPDLSGRGFAGVDTQLTLGEADTLLGSVDATVVTVDAVVEVPVGSRLVLLGRLPVVYATRDEILGQDCCGLSLGNATAGARGLSAIDARRGQRVRLGAEVTVSLPTADDDGEGAEGNGLAALAQLPRDPGRYVPNATVLRAGGSGALQAGRGFVQAEAALHLFFYDDDAAEDSDSALRLGVGGGVQVTGETAVQAELTTFANLDADDGDDDFIHALDLGVRWAGRGGRAGVRFYFPLDDTFRDLDMFGFGVDAGASF